MANFTITELANSRFVVSGTDNFGTSGQTVLDGKQWLDVKARKEFIHAEKDFDQAVVAFFEPLTEAWDALLEKQHGQEADPMSYVVLVEGEEGTPPREEQLVKLRHDSVVLRLIEEGHTDRLMWVDSNIEVLAATKKKVTKPKAKRKS